MHLQPTIGQSLLASVAVAVLLAGCSSGSTAADLAVDPGIVHVHGLATDPAAPDVVLAATHTGLFEIVDGRAQRLGDTYHDLMGFTVAPDGAFLASGHPDMQSEELRVPDRPPLLGLVRSEDRGASWQPRSLLGETDFHALATVDGAIYGADATSGRVLTSVDGETWEQRASAPLLSLGARSGSDGDLLVGSTTDEVLRSDDGGRSWSPISDVGAGIVAATDDGFLVAQIDGRLQASSDGGTWEALGELPGAPEALHSASGTVYAAVTDVGIVRSDDDGATWSAVYEP